MGLFEKARSPEPTLATSLFPEFCRVDLQSLTYVVQREIFSMDTQKALESERPARWKRYAPLWRGLIGLGIALLTALFFFSPVVLPVLTTPIVGVGLDPLSTELISALILVTGAALASAMVSRQRLGATIGAGITYGFSHVLPFIHQELLPHYDPAGHLETLNASVLVHTISVLLASGLL